MSESISDNSHSNNTPATDPSTPMKISLDKAHLINNATNHVKSLPYSSQSYSNNKPTPQQQRPHSASLVTPTSTSNPYSQTHSHAINYGRNRSPSDYKALDSSHRASQTNLRPYVFLGGSCDPTTWRKDIAIPLLTKYKIPFFNPQINDWSPDLIELEARAKEECEILLFVIDSQTRAIASMLEATEFILRDRSVVLVIEDIPAGTLIDNEIVGARQLKDLNRARAFLCDIAARHQKRCDVLNSIEAAVNHIIYSHPSMSPRTNPSPRTPLQ